MDPVMGFVVIDALLYLITSLHSAAAAAAVTTNCSRQHYTSNANQAASQRHALMGRWREKEKERREEEHGEEVQGAAGMDSWQRVV